MQFDVLFSSGSSPSPMTSDLLTEEIKRDSTAFNHRFDEILSPLPPFDSKEYSEFSKDMLSNLIGGIGFFDGDELVDRSDAPEYEEENEGFWEEAEEARSRAEITSEGPRDLFTCVPSRPFFPRGFLWDEGFHLIPIVDWDIDLAYVIAIAVSLGSINV